MNPDSAPTDNILKTEYVPNYKVMNTDSAPTDNVLKTEYAPNYKVINTDSFIQALQSKGKSLLGKSIEITKFDESGRRIEENVTINESHDFSSLVAGLVDGTSVFK